MIVNKNTFAESHVLPIEIFNAKHSFELYRPTQVQEIGGFGEKIDNMTTILSCLKVCRLCMSVSEWIQLCTVGVESNLASKLSKWYEKVDPSI